jgi:hypothetical protein
MKCEPLGLALIKARNELQAGIAETKKGKPPASKKSALLLTIVDTFPDHSLPFIG